MTKIVPEEGIVTAKKKKIFQQITADLVTFTKDLLNGKLPIFCAVFKICFEWIAFPCRIVYANAILDVF